MNVIFFKHLSLFSIFKKDKEINSSSRERLGEPEMDNITKVFVHKLLLSQIRLSSFFR